MQSRLVEEDLLAISTLPAPNAFPTCTPAAVPSPKGICNHRAEARVCVRVMGPSQRQQNNHPAEREMEFRI